MKKVAALALAFGFVVMSTLPAEAKRGCGNRSFKAWKQCRHDRGFFNGNNGWRGRRAWQENRNWNNRPVGYYGNQGWGNNFGWNNNRGFGGWF